MASLSIARPVRSGKWTVKTDATGSLLEEICGGNAAVEAAVGAGIKAVGAGEADTFSLEFSGARVVATPYRQGTVEVVLQAEAETAQDSPRDNQSHKMEALGRLAGGVAHDFANLVTLIAGYTDILLNRIGAQDTCRPELEEIRNASARGAGVTAQILDFVRKKAALPGFVQLNQLVAETMRLLRPIVGEHIGLRVTLEPKLGLVKADPAQMTRVVMNLVLNARDAMPRGGSIGIRTANVDLSADRGHGLPPGSYIMLEISDNGAGMDRETVRQIFKPFFTTKDRGGTGLGLSTVQSIVEQAGGGIWARSEPGQGATFTICLPRAGAENEIADPHSDARGPGAGTETILLAEDEGPVRKLLRHLLDANGYRVLEAADGCDALRLFEQYGDSIDLLLTDIIMPGLNGRELARRVLAAKPGVKVVYMSGYTDDVLLNTDAPGPGMAFLRKPLKLDNLSAVIRDALDARPQQ
jgi:two-component system cell cycle sensor histidine kinase/response regulator CckA